MFKLDLNYTYNKKSNCIDIKIHQEQIAKNYFEKHPFFDIKDVNFDYLKKIGKNINIIDYRTKPNINFNFFFNLNIIQTNGIKIKKEIHKIKLISGKEDYSQNIPLNIKFIKSVFKKKEQEFINELIVDTGIDTIYSNEEIGNIFSQNSILWIRADSESSLIINKIKQQHILYEYIKIFKEGDFFGQIESLNIIGKDQNNFENSLKILKVYIKSNNIYYKLKKYALKIYVKIIKKLNKEEEYQFLMDVFNNCYNELLKDKARVNLENYYLMKYTLKHLSEYLTEYKETNFKIKSKIINKLLNILISNELYCINGYDDCYIMSEILIIISKFDLQDKSNVILEIILKNLIIEKLKRSENEIIIISSLYALINLLIVKDFFFMNLKANKILRTIFKEINYYINNGTENYELLVFCQIFQIFMLFYKSQSFIEFSNHLIKFVLGEEYNNTTKMVFFSVNKNLDMISKIKALNYFLENNLLYFDSPDEKIVFLSSLKIILFSPICYIRLDCRNILENLYDKYYNKDITEKGAGNNNFNNINFLHLLNKNRRNFCSKKYADEKCLYNFINEELIPLQSNSDEEKSVIKGKNNYEEIQKYQNKYKNDEYALHNMKINLENSFNDILIEIIDKLLGHPISESFKYNINKKKNIIKNPIDLSIIRKKVNENIYENFSSFNKDVSTMFNNYISLNQKDSSIYNKAVQLQDYYNILIYPIIQIKNKEENEMQNIIKESDNKDIIIFSNNNNNELKDYYDKNTILNRKRNLEIVNKGFKKKE